ncbi:MULTISPECIES: nuclear transport factor 2 family protein [unclassified Mesorhizobium]|uniref:nuclear transport factor 2 family protein n=1 Tax=unclassified Mesorhizobium TaxID=325217 RepID=UPI000F764DDD|nr:MULTISPECIES: nuclear transport factor 2 family protein [unclassified Mesorhizobium]AZO13518.1 nuclear transport factor 2 family protein [Mesorhizobium sp. M2A.F.Ca.ET.043.05.1.1]RWE65352.1 MAG: nuclear transport factor 2 family protein [Mesorhizobium sp.]TIV25130.1 MAG: nuclear transport factor 2 family protein [Mesorhizobium sp.]
MRAVDIVSNLYKAYADRDIEGALSRCAEDVVFRWIADPRQSRHAGTAHGKQEFLSRLLALDDDFEYRHFVPVEIIDGGDKVAAQVEIHLTRRTTGEELIMRTANFWTVRDGEIIEMVEYYDTALAASVF